MSSSKLPRFVVAVALLSGLAGAGVAHAAPQTHHCKMPDGTMDLKKTHKQCTAAKGTWFKDVPTPPPAPSAPAPAK